MQKKDFVGFNRVVQLCILPLPLRAFWGSFSHESLQKTYSLLAALMYHYMISFWGAMWKKKFSPIILHLWRSPVKDTLACKICMYIPVDPTILRTILLLWNQFRCEKVSEHICLCPPRGEVGGSKDGHFRNIKMYENGEVDSHQGWTVLKIRIISKKASNKSSWAFNFLRKSQGAHMSISHQRGARVLSRWPFSKY